METVSEMQMSWRTMMVGGVLLALGGLLAIFFPFVTGLSLSVALGAILVVVGFIHGAHAFSAQGWKGALWQAVLGVVSVVAGILVLANPILGLTTLTLLLIAYFVVDGVVEIVWGARIRGQSRWGWAIASGVLSLIVAGLLWAGFPASATWAVGLLFGVGLLSTGVTMMMFGMEARNAARVEDQEPTQPRGAV